MNHEECKYQDCTYRSVTTFALVPLCEEHHHLVVEETLAYYQPKYRNVRMQYIDRFHFHKISNLIPWSRLMKDGVL